MRGKYSPTVSAAYQKDQEWWHKYTFANQTGDNYLQYDPEGFDSYGYDTNDLDRAGNYKHDYYRDDHDGENWKYNTALDEWTFDGVKPVNRYERVESEPDQDTREEVTINLYQEELHQLMLLAHEQDITLNRLVEQILRIYIIEQQND